MGDWTITGKSKDQIEMTVEAMTCGFATAPTTYTVTHNETGVEKRVSAYSEEGAGKKIEEGQFLKD